MRSAQNQRLRTIGLGRVQAMASLPLLCSQAVTETILITGISSGIGKALCLEYLRRGARVYAIGRSDLEPADVPERPNFIAQDLSQLEAIPAALDKLLCGVPTLDRVILNAGVLGPIRDLRDTPMHQLRAVMDLNTWANKAIVDSLVSLGVEFKQVIGISSGAAVSGNRGWNSYSLSKAAFLMLLRLYAAELPATHFCSLAPGLVDTAMQDYLCGLDREHAIRFPSVARIQGARGTINMPDPDELAPRLIAAFDTVRDQPSGAFIDIRKM